MRVCFIGCVASSLHALETLISLNEICLTGVLTRETSFYNSDYINLRPLCEEYRIPWAYTGSRIERESLAFLQGVNPDAIFCVGWSSLLPKEILDLAPLGVIGFHPSPLPIGRGRHPLIWPLVLGLPQTASTFFFMDEGADSGDIISQTPVAISNEDTAATLYDKIMRIAKKQLVDFVPDMARGNICRLPQDHSKASYWRKRNRCDGAIDFRMNADAVCNLVKALSSPYPGAHVLYKNQEIKIWKAEMVSYGEPYHEPGKILSVKGRELIIKCGSDAVLLRSHEIEDMPVTGEYLL